MDAIAVARSLRRVVVLFLLLASFLLLTAFIALRQPVLPSSAKDMTHADPARLRAHVLFLTNDAAPRGSDDPGLDIAASYVRREFERTGARVSDQAFEARGRTFRNVIADFGPDLDAAPLVIGAHYDAFTSTGALPGADDNASGTAGLLDLARLLGKSPPQHHVQLVAFSTEEPPFFGSQEMGSAFHANGTKGIRGMICLEMIGYFTDDTQAWPSWVLSWFYPKRGNFIAVTGGWEDRSLARDVKRAMQMQRSLPVYSFTGPRAMLDASDQRSYWARGWKAVMITDTAYLRNPNYHTKRDTAETLNYERMADVVTGLKSAVMALSE
jgi:hypothetical protein